jgi:addiction module HigA family antidote
LTQSALASHAGTSQANVNRIVNGRSPVTPELAIMLGLTFGTTPLLWINAQLAVDMHDAEKNLKHRPGRLKAG